MKRLNILLTTTLLALGLMLATTSAMADPANPELKVNGSDAVFICVGFQNSIVPGMTISWFELFGFKNFGQCVSFFKPGK